jgi:hypothetical protein
MAILLPSKNISAQGQQLIVNWDHPFFQGSSFGYVFVNGVIFCKDGRVYEPYLNSRVGHKDGLQIGASTKTQLFPVSTLENTLNFSVLATGHDSSNNTVATALGNQYHNCLVDGIGIVLGNGAQVGPTSRKTATITGGISTDPVAVSFNGSMTQSDWLIYTKGRKPAITTSGSATTYSYGAGLYYYSGWDTPTQVNKALRSVLWAKSGKNCPAALLASLSENPWQIFAQPARRFIFAPQATGNTSGDVAYGQLTLTGQTVTGYSTTYGYVGYGSLSLTGQDPATTGVSTGEVNYGQITLTGQQPTVLSGTTGTAVNGTLDYTCYAPTTSSSATTGTANNGEFVLTGYTPGGYGTTTGIPSFGDIALTGYTPTIYGTTTDTANYGEFALTGYAPTSYSPSSGVITQGDIDAIANAVWAHSSAVLIEQRLLEAWGRLGLDPTAPLITGQTTITFGSIVMAMTEAAGNITVTRQ